MASRSVPITWFTDLGVLRCLHDMASNPSIPHLNNAAVTTLRILRIIEQVKDGKTHFQTLGLAVVALFATAFEVYSGTDIRRWANYDLVENLDEMVRSLQSIQRFVEQYAQMGRFFRLMALLKRRKIKRFRKLVDDVARRLELQLPLPRNGRHDVNADGSTTFFTQNINFGSVIHQGSNILKQGSVFDHSHSLTDHGQLNNDHNQVSARLTNSNHGIVNKASGKVLPDLPLLGYEQPSTSQTRRYDSSGHCQARAPSRAFSDNKSHDSRCDDDQSSSFIEVEYPEYRSR